MGCGQMPPALEKAETLVSVLSWGTCFQVLGLCLLPQPPSVSRVSPKQAEGARRR